MKKLIEAILNMECGDIILIQVNEDGCTDFFTKTQWFDNCVYILGGAGLPSMIFDSDIEDIEEIIKKIHDFYDFEPILFDSDSGTLSISAKSSDFLKNRKKGNFNFEMR